MDIQYYREGMVMSDEFKVGDWVLIQLHPEVYQITKIYKEDDKTVVDLDDGDNFKLTGKPIDIIKAIPKRNER
jgi:hypothetical protein